MYGIILKVIENPDWISYSFEYRSIITTVVIKTNKQTWNVDLLQPVTQRSEARLFHEAPVTMLS